VRIPGVLAVALLTAATASVAAQQDGDPPRAGTDGVPLPEVVRYVEPDYPPIAAMVRISGIVALDVVIDEEGQPRDVRVTRSIPLLADAALAAVRGWRFSPPTVNGGRGPVVASVRVNFVFGRPAPRTVTRLAGQSAGLALEYRFRCSAGEAHLSTASGLAFHRGGAVSALGIEIAPAQLQTVYDALVPTALLARAGLRQQTQQRSAPAAEGDVIIVTVLTEPAIVSVVTSGPPPRSFGQSLDVWLQDAWYRLTWAEPRETAGAARSEELERIGALLRQIVRDTTEVLALPQSAVPCL
jgi:periplasmic protein TonB